MFQVLAGCRRQQAQFYVHAGHDEFNIGCTLLEVSKTYDRSHKVYQSNLLLTCTPWSLTECIVHTASAFFPNTDETAQAD